MDKQKCERVTLQIRDLTEQGQGIGSDETGFVYFIDKALPGETVEATVQAKKKTYATATLNSIKTISKDRIEPPCSLSGRCGGCQLQHLSYEAELVWKENRVRHLLEKIGGLADIGARMHPIAGSDEPFHYRNKVSIPVGGTTISPRIGFFTADSREIVDGDGCLVQPKATEAVRACLRRLIKERGIEPYDRKTHQGLLRHIVVRTSGDGERIMVVLVTTKDTPLIDESFAESIRDVLEENGQAHLTSLYLNINRSRSAVIEGHTYRHIWGDKHLETDLNGLTFRLMPQAFFQINTRQAKKLFEELTALAVAHFPSEKPHALDLYGGTGAIALHLARAGFFVTGVDIVEAAVADAKANARRNNLDKAVFVTADAVQYAGERLEKGDIRLLVLDPPRKGVEKTLLQQITTLHAEKKRVPEAIFYVSCNPATLARDLALLKDSYDVTFIRPYDFFPWTGHVETVVLMSRKG